MRRLVANVFERKKPCAVHSKTAKIFEGIPLFDDRQMLEYGD